MNWLESSLANFRHRLAHADALPQLAILGVLSGLFTGGIAVLFRLAVEVPLSLALPGRHSENFESLPWEWRLGLPLTGALFLGLLFYGCKGDDKESRSPRLGVGHVIERYQQFQARLPIKNALLQFLGGALALLSGFAGGREGPAVHLGAAASSQIGQGLSLPNNSLRTLVGCGVASAVAASFNTPLAGVVFAMEVVLMEYTITGFIPIILAAVSGTVISRIAFGSEPAFSIPALQMASLWELPYLALCGLVIGLAATAMLLLYRFTRLLNNLPLWLRLGAAGIITAAAGLLVPEIMGIGYDTLEQAILGELGFRLLLTIVVAKLVVSTITVALGIPAGLIGPTLVMGACLGGCLGIIGAALNPADAASTGFYSTLGMGAMMAAVLNAPLAALIAILELTYNPGILMPAMLVIVIACISARIASRQPGLFLIGRKPGRYTSPVFQMLSRAGVTSLMNTRLRASGQSITWEQAKAMLADKPDWLIIAEVGEPRQMLRPSELAHFLEAQDTSLWDEDRRIDLMEIPAERRPLSPIHPSATLQEALLLMQQENSSAVYVTRTSSPLQSDVAGVLTRQDIDNYYQ